MYLHDRNYVSYTRIGGGNYTFRVKAANRDNIRNENELILKISVTTISGVSSLENMVGLYLLYCCSDIVHFKLYNDFYGHPAGDSCIKEVADIITESCVRTSDIPVRYGGEEFLVLLPQTDAAGALFVAETIRKSIVDKKIKHEKSSISDWVTISIGVASIIPSTEISPMVLVENADKALYESKNRGRNQVFLFKDNYASNG